MEIFVVKKECEIKKIIHDYFFTYLDQHNYEINNDYFISNKIIDKKYSSNYFFAIPFKILGRILDSIRTDHISLIGNIFISPWVWSEENFREEIIENISWQIELLSTLSNEIDVFLRCFDKDRKVNKKAIEELAEVMVLKREKSQTSQNNARMPQSFDDSESFHSLYLEINQNSSKNQGKVNFVECLLLFLNHSMKMYNTLNTSVISDYDYFEDSNQCEEKRIILNIRVQITKYYSNVILKLLLEDIRNVIFHKLKLQMKSEVL